MIAEYYITVKTEEIMESHEICEFYGDYYEHVARSKHIRPIKVTEGVNFSALSSSRKILWCCKTVLNLLG